MSHPLFDVIRFEIIAPYTLQIWFNDGTDQIINFEPVLHGEMYSPLRDLALFNRVRLDNEVRTLVWENGADFDPYILHEWPRLALQLTEQAKTWEQPLAIA